jgi:SAM-dependent methyltransferase
MSSERERLEANRANWDERAGIHAESRGYELDKFRSDPNHISGVVEFDRTYLGDLTGLRAVHLQCHIGTDTISLARLGAEVIGLDQSSMSIEVAEQLFAVTHTPGRFVTAPVYDAVTALDATFDLVYTGVGALNWLPDIDRWAHVGSSLLEPGGRLYLREGHPMLYAFDDDLTADGRLQLRYPYFETDEPMVFDEEETYVETDARISNTRTYEWNHGLSEVFTALQRHGLQVTDFVEHRILEWKMFDHMVDAGDGRWQLPPDQRDLCPLMYSLGAIKYREPAS